MALLAALGSIKPTAGQPLPAMPASLAANYTQPVSSFIARALPGNTAGKCYLLSNNSPADKTAFSNVLWYFTMPNESISFDAVGANVYDLRQMYVDVDNTGDGIAITVEVY